MTTRSKLRKLLGIVVTVVLAAVPLLWPLVSHDPRHEPSSINSHHQAPDGYAIRKKVVPPNYGIAEVDGSVQLTFPADSKISPGSLEKMTEEMRESEIEVATKLNRKIEVP